MRNVNLTLTNAMPVDAVKAVAKRVENIEKRYAQDPASVTDIADIDDVKAVLIGNTPYKAYIFNVAITKATATYIFEFLEEAPNVETATTTGINGNA